jgi:hypothetical protein
LESAQVPKYFFPFALIRSAKLLAVLEPPDEVVLVVVLEVVVDVVEVVVGSVTIMLVVLLVVVVVDVVVGGGPFKHWEYPMQRIKTNHTMAVLYLQSLK